MCMRMYTIMCMYMYVYYYIATLCGAFKVGLCVCICNMGFVGGGFVIYYKGFRVLIFCVLQVQDCDQNGRRQRRAV